MGLLASSVEDAVTGQHEVENVIPGEPWMYGLAGLAVLLVLLWIVTRFDQTR